MNVAVLGSTGSIGRNTIEVLEVNSRRMRLTALSAHSNLDEAVRQANRLRPKWLVATNEKEASEFDWSCLPPETSLRVGPAEIDEIVSSDEVDTVVSAIVGSAGLPGTWAAVEAGKRIALANKETLVVAGPLVMKRARQSGAEIIPVDSEHSAILQAMSAGSGQEVRRIILTASGGPFRQHTPSQLAAVTVGDALAHPTWDMGPKITIDSATMMNKALEIIEARWLFGLQPDQIEVVVHPQSIVHSMVEFVDGSVIAQLSPPDMKLPIQYALTYPRRFECATSRIDWKAAMTIDFQPPDRERFPALDLGYEVARMGGTAGAVLNGANEAAVQEFLDGNISFVEIVPICRSILNNHHFDSQPTLQALMEQDGWARREVTKWICA